MENKFPEKKLNLENIENIEVVRSFSRKANLGNYETADMFASYKAIVEKGTPIDRIEEISQELYEQCQKEVNNEADKYYKQTKSPF